MTAGDLAGHLGDADPGADGAPQGRRERREPDVASAFRRTTWPATGMDRQSIMRQTAHVRSGNRRRRPRARRPAAAGRRRAAVRRSRGREDRVRARPRRRARASTPRRSRSPTFTLIQEYRGGRLPLLPRRSLSPDSRIEVDDLGLDEMTTEGGVTAIEWPDRLPRPFDDGDHAIRIEHGHDNHRTIHIDR